MLGGKKACGRGPNCILPSQTRTFCIGLHRLSSSALMSVPLMACIHTVSIMIMGTFCSVDAARMAVSFGEFDEGKNK